MVCRGSFLFRLRLNRMREVFFTSVVVVVVMVVAVDVVVVDIAAIIKTELYDGIQKK